MTIAQDIVLQPFERAIVRAKLLPDDLEPFMFRTVLIIVGKCHLFRGYPGNRGGDRFSIHQSRKLNQQRTTSQKGTMSVQ